MSERGAAKPWGYFVLKLALISASACVPAYFAWITNNGIKPYFEEHGLGHDAAHTGLALASCIMHVIFPYVRTIMQFMLSPAPLGNGYNWFSGVPALVTMVFDCVTAKYAWEWYQLFGNAGEAVLEKNCLALFILVIIGLAVEGIILVLFVLFLLSMCGYAVVSSAVSAA
ncbi:hypothetical protein PG993_014392 [Apiospora rasikravindrae]|uniref:Uncharacterized protein n=1 Tax=Apiospora rasikravindrae TaxID=990691 RepID=A0ABR1RPM1_9PEZI